MEAQDLNRKGIRLVYLIYLEEQNQARCETSGVGNQNVRGGGGREGSDSHDQRSQNPSQINESLSIKDNCPICKQVILVSDLKTHVCHQLPDEMAHKQEAGFDQLKQVQAYQEIETE